MDDNTIKSLDFDAVCLPPDKQIPLHSQSTWELSCVITGEGTRVLGDVSERFSAGDTVLIPPATPHCWYFDRSKIDAEGNIENVSIFFHGELLANLQALFPEMSAPMAHITAQKSAIIFSGESREAIYSTMLRMRNETSAKRLLSLLEILLIIAEDKTGRAISGVQPMSRQQMRIAQIKSFVNCNYMHKISIDEIASHIGMSRSSFCSFFKRETGQTFTEYLNEKRIELACELLENKEMNINEVGQAVGIPDTPYFCRFFKTIKGVTPTEYRNRVKNNQIVIWQQ